MKEKILSNEEIERELAELNVAWSAIPAHGLVRVFDTKSFSESLTVAFKIGDIAEKLSHYPEVIIRSDQVEISIITEEYGITELDFEFAKEIDKLFLQ